MLRRVALVRTDVSEELSTSFMSVKIIGELGTTLALTRNRRTQHGVKFKKTPFVIVTAVKTSNLTWWKFVNSTEETTSGRKSRRRNTEFSLQ
jgi:hypothetical protein